MKVGIVKGYRGLERSYIKACTELGIEYDLIDVFDDDNWIGSYDLTTYDSILIRPPCDTHESRSFFHDIIELIEKRAPGRLYPSKDALAYYENKRLLSYLLKAKEILHPETQLAHTKESFFEKVQRFNYPLVLKSIVGSGSSSVKVIKNQREARRVATKVFGIHPSLAIGLIPKSAQFTWKYFVPQMGRTIKHAMLLQEYVEFKWEWRIAIVGNVFFGYKKMKNRNGFASGSGLFSFGLPPIELLERAYEDSVKLQLHTGAIDYFETSEGEYLLNEAQAIFGSKPKNISFPNSHMFDNEGRPCVFRRVAPFNYNKYIGEFCHNSCDNLRVLDSLGLVNEDYFDGPC